jgi:hypothetical protein
MSYFDTNTKYVCPLELQVEYYNEDGYTVYSFFNRFHYGDNLLNLKFFFNISSILKSNHIKINYYYDQRYNTNQKELLCYTDPETLKLFDIHNRPSDANEAWMGLDINGINHNKFDSYYPLFYKNIVSQLKLDTKSICTDLFQPEPYLRSIYEKLSTSFKNIDILIINCEPQSGQFNYNKEAMDSLCKKLSTKYKICSTEKVDNSISFTRNESLTLQDIGAISTHAKYVIAVSSGPLTTCFNKDSLEHVKKWFLLDNNLNFINTPNITMIRSSEELKSIESFFLLHL